MIDGLLAAAIIGCACTGVLLLLFLIVLGFAVNNTYECAVEIGKDMIVKLQGGLFKWLV